MLQLKLNNFEKYIDEPILSRGYSYYITELVNEENEEDGRYTFTVQGSEDYEVEIKISKTGEIEESNCDCPYDYGPICKHEVAAYYYLNQVPSSVDKSKKTKQISLQDVLKGLSKEELINIIIEITKNDRALKQKIVYHYSNMADEDDIAKFKELVNFLVNKYAGREKFIRYHETGRFATDMSNLAMNGAEKALNNKNQIAALTILIIALEEALESFQYADDSSGEIGMLITEIIGKIDDVIKDVIKSEDAAKQEIFNKLLEYMDTKALNDWQDYRIDLLHICFQFTKEKKYRDSLKNKLQDLICNENCEYSTYYKEEMLMMLYKIMRQYENKEKTDLFIKENLQYTSFRELMMSQLKVQGNYEEIINLALEGEAKDKDLPGLVSKWKGARYEAYKRLSLKKEQEKLARDLLLHGDFQYYEELKGLHKGNELVLYNEIKNEIKKDRYKTSLYLQLIVYEKDLQEVLDYVKKNPIRIEQFAHMLIDKHEEEVISIYKEYIFLMSKLASDRKKYREVCRTILRFKKLTSKIEVNEVVTELRLLYKNRPAFLDELSKVISN